MAIIMLERNAKLREKMYTILKTPTFPAYNRLVYIFFNLLIKTLVF